MDPRAAAYHIGNASPAFVSNMRRLLQVKAAVHYEHGFKSGKIAPGRMYRVGLPPIDGGDWNSRVFRKCTQESHLLDTAILLLVDWSGSMHGSKATTAARAAGLCNDAFGRVLRVPLSIVAFTSSGPTPKHAIVKDFDSRVSADDVAERFADFKLSGNNDADSLLWAYYKILPRKERRKIIIVLSDGSPADGYGDPVYALKCVTKQIVDEKRVDLYGIGILDSNVKMFYPKWKIVNKITDLEPALVDVMGKALT